MTKSLLEEIQECEIAMCPGCTGPDGYPTGLADTPANQQGPGSNGRRRSGGFKWQGKARTAMPKCPLCQGEGFVFLNRICECGGPAILLDKKEKVWTCGSKACLQHAIYRKTFASGKAEAQDMYDEADWMAGHMGWHGMGG